MLASRGELWGMYYNNDCYYCSRCEIVPDALRPRAPSKTEGSDLSDLAQGRAQDGVKAAEPSS